MRGNSTGALLALLLICPLLLAPGALHAQDPSPAPKPTPETPEKEPTPTAPPTWQEIGPLLDEFCTHCHGGEGPTRGLDLGTLAGVKKGSRAGAVVDAKEPAESELILRLKGEVEPRMPLDGPPYFTAAQIARVEAWIAAGLPEGKPPQPKDGEEPPSEKGAGDAKDTEKPKGRKPPGPDEDVTWAHVSPIFAKRCVKCHKDGGLRGDAPEGLELFSLEKLRAGGERVALVPGNPLASPIVRHIRGIASPRMPLDGPPYLSKDEIALIVRWVAGGAKDATGKASPVPVGRKVRYRGRLTGRWEIDGLKVIVDRGTRIDKSPRIGDEAEVRGVIQADGSVRATRLRRR